MTVAALAFLSLQKLPCLNLLQGIREDSDNVYPITPRCQFRTQAAIIPAEDNLRQGKTIVNWVNTKLQAVNLFFSRVIHVKLQILSILFFAFLFTVWVKVVISWRFVQLFFLIAEGRVAKRSSNTQVVNTILDSYRSYHQKRPSPGTFHLTNGD